MSKTGKRFLEHLADANNAANPELMRLALKLATGAGKTTAMAMIIAWQTINAVRQPGSSRFTGGFLVVTPGLTIRDRLRVLQPNDPDSYYRDRELVPGDMLGELDRAKIVITNYHGFQLRERVELSKGGRSLLQGRGEELNTLETEGQMIQRVMPGLTIQSLATFGMAVINGTTLTPVSLPTIPNEFNAPVPVVQREDGSIVGTVSTVDNNGNPLPLSMMAFDLSGKVLWVVPNDQPMIATDGGGVIGQSGITYDQNGGATGQVNLATQSWIGNMYQTGSVVAQVAIPPAVLAVSFWAEQLADDAKNKAGTPRNPTTIQIQKAFGHPQDCYSSVGGAQSTAERDIIYEVVDKYRRPMGTLMIQERLTPLSGSPCPAGTTLQNSICVGQYIRGKEFDDTLGVNPLTGRQQQFTQTFWVQTLPNVPSSAAFNGQVTIDAYQPSPSLTTSLNETKFMINVNGNTGLNANGTPVRRCQ